MSELETLNKNLTDVTGKVTEIYNLLIGPEHDKESGYLSRVKYLEDRVEKLCDFKNKVIYVAIGMSVPTGMGLLQIFHFLVGLK